MRGRGLARRGLAVGLAAALAAALAGCAGGRGGSMAAGGRPPARRVALARIAARIRTADAQVRAEGEGLVVDCLGRRSFLEIPLDVDASLYNVIEVVSEAGSRSQHAPFLRWKAAGGGYSRRDEIKFPPTEAGGGERRHLLHVETEPGWRGRIEGVRIFPTDHPGRVILRSLRFLSLSLEEIAAASGAGGRIRSFRIGSETRRVRFVPVGRPVEEVLKSEGGGERRRLAFAFGVPDYKWKALRGAVRFVVSLAGKDGRFRAVFQGSLRGGERASDRGWHDASVEVPAGLPGEIRVRWETFLDGEGSGEVPAFIAHPVLVDPDAPVRGPNVLLVSIDTLRADHLSSYGHPRPVSPVLDRLARESLEFRDAKSQAAKTLPSHVSLFTSLYPSVHGVVDETDRLAEAWPSLGSCLSRAGYSTAAFTEDAFVSGVFGFAAGFDRYHDGSYHLLGAREPDRGGDVRATVRRALEFLHRCGNRPFFLFVHTYEAHTPYCPQAPYRGEYARGYDGPIPDCVPESLMRTVQGNRDRYLERDVDRIRSLYDEEIRFTDAVLGDLLRGLEEAGLKERTLLIVTSDHGEDLEDHRAIARHGHTLYEELLHVPLIVRLPGASRPCGVVDAPVGLVDLAPTILEILGIEVPASFQGSSFARLLRGEPPLPRVVYAENRSLFRRLALQLGRWKYIRNLGWNPHKVSSPEEVDPLSRGVYGSEEAEELYRLDTDPAERRNLALEDDAPAALVRLRDLAGEFERGCRTARRAGPGSPRGGSVRREILEKLRRLGYLGGGEGGGER